MPRFDRDDPYDVVQTARDKVFPPALALMIAAILGMVSGLGLIAFAVVFGLFMEDVAEKIDQQQQAAIQQQQQFQRQQAQLNPPPPGVIPVAPPVRPAPPFDMKTFFKIYGAMYGVGGAFLFAMSVVILIGAIKMKSLRSYGWAMTGTITGIACVFTCNWLAVGFGIWGLIVLMQPEVKEGFARAADGDLPRSDRRGEEYE